MKKQQKRTFFDKHRYNSIAENLEGKVKYINQNGTLEFLEKLGLIDTEDPKKAWADYLKLEKYDLDELKEYYTTQIDTTRRAERTFENLVYDFELITYRKWDDSHNFPMYHYSHNFFERINEEDLETVRKCITLRRNTSKHFWEVVLDIEPARELCTYELNEKAVEMLDKLAALRDEINEMFVRPSVYSICGVMYDTPTGVALKGFYYDELQKGLPFKSR